MSLDFHFAPFLPQYILGIDQKGAAFYTHDFFTVHVFLFDDIKQFAQLLIRISEQVERKTFLLPEFFMCIHRVTRDAKYDGIVCLEFFHVVAEVLSFHGAPGGAVFRIEIEDDFIALEV